MEPGVGEHENVSALFVMGVGEDMFLRPMASQSVEPLLHVRLRSRDGCQLIG